MGIRMEEPSHTRFFSRYTWNPPARASCLDTLVEEAWKVEGVIGSRMTGAGFGGCTVSIVRDEAIDQFIEKVGRAYKSRIGYAADSSQNFRKLLFSDRYRFLRILHLFEPE